MKMDSLKFCVRYGEFVRQYPKDKSEQWKERGSLRVFSIYT